MRRYASPSISSITEKTQRNLIKLYVYIKISVRGVQFHSATLLDTLWQFNPPQ
jgi:hypothetical protein